MPKIQQMNKINITVEKFLDCCSDNELYEVYLNLNNPRYHNRLAKYKGPPKKEPEGIEAGRARERFGMENIPPVPEPPAARRIKEGKDF